MTKIVDSEKSVYLSFLQVSPTGAL